MSKNHVPTADEVALLRQSVRDALNSHCDGLPDERWPETWPANWDALGEQGLWSTIEPPDGSLMAAVVVAEELGRVLYPGPAYEALAARYVLARLGEPDSLPSAVADGSPPVVFAAGAVAFDDADSTVYGTLDPAVRVPPETVLLVPTGLDGFVVTPVAEADQRAMPSLDVSRRIVQLDIRKQPVTVVSAPDGNVAQYGRAARRLLYCADTLGCIDHVLKRTIDYAKQRTTFGSPIGRYQAVAHRLVDHSITAQQMRLLLYEAIATFDEGTDDLELQIAAAETLFSGRATDIISDCIQLTGAVGFTWEFGYHFYLRRAAQNASLGDGPRRPHQRLAQEATW